MPYVTGMLIIDAPAAALNNAGMDDNLKANVTKHIKTAQGNYPYVSAQSFRFWLRNTLALMSDTGWKTSPVYKENENLAFPDGNPIEYWDDDLFGYMRAPSSKEGRAFASGMETPTKKAKKGKPEDSEAASKVEGKQEKPTLTRVSPFRVGTLISIAPTHITTDFGTMTRHEEGNPVIHKHQFYRSHLCGLFSLDLTSAGTFYNSQKVGYRNLDPIRLRQAQELNLAEGKVRRQDALRLPIEERQKRVATLIRGLSQLEGGAKQALHYTDVAPAVVVAAITRGGNHPFNRIFVPGSDNSTRFHTEAFLDALTTFAEDLLSPLFIGWSHGFLDQQRQVMLEALGSAPEPHRSTALHHPRVALGNLAEELSKNEHSDWYA